MPLSDTITLINDGTINGFAASTGTEAQRLALTPTTGEQFYQTDEAEGFYIYDGSRWVLQMPFSENGQVLLQGSTTLTGQDTTTTLLTYDFSGGNVLFLHSFLSMTLLTASVNEVAGYSRASTNAETFSYAKESTGGTVVGSTKQAQWLDSNISTLGVMLYPEVSGSDLIFKLTNGSATAVEVGTQVRYDYNILVMLSN